MLLGTKKNQQTNTGPLFSLFSTKNRNLRILQISSRSVEIIGGLKKPPSFFLSKTRGKLLPNEQKRKAPKLIHVYDISFWGEVFFFRETSPKKPKQNKTKEITTPDWMVQCRPYQPIVGKKWSASKRPYFFFYWPKNKWPKLRLFSHGVTWCHQNQFEVFLNRIFLEAYHPLTTERPVG